MRSVNRLLCRNMASGRFATFCYARVEPDASRIVYSNAGHNPPLVVRAGNGTATLSVGGMVLGIFPENVYAQGESPSVPGDRVVFYTDGITEARNPEGRRVWRRAAGRSRHRRPCPSSRGDEGRAVCRRHGVQPGKFDDDATLIVVGV